MDSRVGLLFRDGNPVYYGHLNGAYFERSTPAAVVSTLNNHKASPPLPRPRQLRPYIVSIRLTRPYCDDRGTEIEVAAYSGKEAIRAARKQAYKFYDRHDGPKTYSARRA